MSRSTACLLAMALGVAAGCSSSPGSSLPAFDAQLFVAQAANPLFPLVPGTTRIYESDTAEGLERIEVEVTAQTRVVLGVVCVVVRDTVTLDGELVEDTFDWFAADRDGNIWYFGEDSKEYENGIVVSTEGSWEGGVDGAEPGIVMLAAPYVGASYRQEFYAGVAEDQASVLSLDAVVVVPAGTFSGCLKTEDFTPLEPGVLENKFYAPGVGVVLEIADDGTRVELVAIQ